MIKYTILIVILLYMLPVMCSLACSSESKERSILIIGDAPVFDAALLPFGFVNVIKKTVLKKCPQFTIHIEGQPDWTTLDTVEYIDEIYRMYKPTDVILITGTYEAQTFAIESDVDMRQDLMYFHERLEQSVVKMLNYNINVTLCSPFVVGEKTSGNRYDYVIEEIIGSLLHIATDYHQHHVQFVDVRSELINQIEVLNKENLHHNTLTFDGVHLNEKGHKVVANCLLVGYFHIFDVVPHAHEYELPCMDGDEIVSNFMSQRDHVVIPREGIHNQGREIPKLHKQRQQFFELQFQEEYHDEL